MFKEKITFIFILLSVWLTSYCRVGYIYCMYVSIYVYTYIYIYIYTCRDMYLLQIYIYMLCNHIHAWHSLHVVCNKLLCAHTSSLSSFQFLTSAATLAMFVLVSSSFSHYGSENNISSPADVQNRCADVCFWTDVWNRCGDEASKHKSLQMAVQKVKVPADQTNKLSVES